MRHTLALLIPLMSTACCDGTACDDLGVVDLQGDLVPGEAIEFQMQVGVTHGRCAGIVGEFLPCEERLEVVLNDDILPTQLRLHGPTRPWRASVLVARDGEIVLDETFRIEDRDTRPRAPTCGSGCRGFRTAVQW